ncbi:ATP-binding protein [Cellvibrio japonicus]|uniref:AAA superfamily ATPase n=1 Tax=Cellvibrio japonicus (strain Ueda107) TaxID=498211 RepID=B3PHU3_CELJU|nr:ATP-binding protein [Cellvibrio japonicus]ACE85535.1 AAA superfamily ATPase [Cellvibrio japonicus Ueda107]QEI13883.1 ATP-binding protein [Cellvibrio japonicus]QEI17457.1 ATP-binding protein [Cellvibrio japonicus]QEI21033.1 ATP-binding protein [Cellvibrio japonicus]
MNPDLSHANALALEQELAWFAAVLDLRFTHYFGSPDTQASTPDIRTLAPPDLSADNSGYARILHEHQFGFDERLVLILCLIPHLRPQALDIFFTQSQVTGRTYTEFGGWRGKAHNGFLPTAETAVFLLAGQDLQRRFSALQLFDEQHALLKKGILKLEHQASGEPFLNAVIAINTEYLHLCTHGQVQKPDYSMEFPAKLITSKLTWDDLVLSREVMEEIDHLHTWLRQGRQLVSRWGLERSIKPGYRSLFFGPPGTGKTLTATLLGASVGVDVYRIDLSMVVSKYIGETEKNLAGVFDQAQNKNWILFFDEADALFGKRTQTSNSNDRHANQEISYLLQRVEDFPGVVILASNIKANIDEAFARRFQSIIYFPLPDEVERLRLWQNLLANTQLLASDVDLPLLAEKYELSGGSLTNVARYAAIRASRLGREQINQADLLQGINKELLKEGRTL